MKFKVIAFWRKDSVHGEVIIDTYDQFFDAYNAYFRLLESGDYDCYLTILVMEDEK